MDPKMANRPTQIKVTIAIQTSLGHLRAASPKKSSTGALSRPSSGSNSQPAR